MSSHSAFLYGSADELVRHALTAHRPGLPLVLGCSPRHNALITAALAPGSAATSLPRPRAGARPGTAIAVLERLARENGPMTALVEPDHGATDAGTARWRRFEAACNLTFAAESVTLICAFDRRTTPGTVLAALAESHERHDDPEAVLARLAVRAPLVPPPSGPALVVLGSETISDLGPITWRTPSTFTVRLSSGISPSHDVHHNGAVARLEAAQVRAGAALGRAEAARVRAKATRERLESRTAPPR